MQQLGGSGVDTIARSVGVSDGDVTKVLSGALPAMMAGLNRNATSGGGANALLGALDRDHDGSILDDVMGYLGGGGNATDGAGILGHVFGGRQTDVEQAVSRSSGVDAGSVSSIMAMIAPLLMGALGKAKRQQGFDASGLASALGQQERVARRTAPSGFDMIAGILDGDGDGSAMDDVARIGGGLLSGLFGRKR
jgi:hypothetical protein